jgi:hypothetical protein
MGLKGLKDDLATERKDLLTFRNSSDSHKRLHARVLLLLMFTLLVDLLAAALISKIVKEDNLTTFWTAFIWASSQLLAGGSSLTAMKTGGHWMEVVLEFFDITVVAALAGSFAAFFHERGAARDANPQNRLGS